MVMIEVLTIMLLITVSLAHQADSNLQHLGLNYAHDSGKTVTGVQGIPSVSVGKMFGHC